MIHTVDPVSLALRPVVDLVRDFAQRIRRVRVRTHEAAFISTGVPAIFVNVVNVGRRPVTVTHVWFATEPPLPVIRAERPLEERLKPDAVWETWALLSELGTRIAGMSLNERLSTPRVQLSTGRVIKARPNQKKVPPAGEVPGGRRV